MNYEHLNYQPTEEDLNDYREFLMSEEQEQISKLREYHEERMPERFFNLVVWDYEFPEIVEASPVSNPQMHLFSEEGF